MRLILCLALSLFAPREVFAGGEVGNGGDVLLCSAGQTASQISHSFDAYVARQWETEEIKIIESTSDGRTRLLAIASRLEPLNRELARDLTEFADDLFRGPDYSRARVWLPSDLPLTPIEDENSEIVVEAACQLPNSMKPNLFQAVIRHARSKTTTFFYNKEALQRLSDRPTDLAFLLLHEWLWTYTSDVIALRQLNFLLNSTWLERVSEADFAKSWNGLTGGSQEPQPDPKPEACTVNRVDNSKESSDLVKSWSSCLDFFESVKALGPAPKSLFYQNQQMLGQPSFGSYICWVELRGGTGITPQFAARSECENFLKDQFKTQPATSQPVRAYFNMDRIY